LSRDAEPARFIPYGLVSVLQAYPEEKRFPTLERSRRREAKFL